MNFISRIAAVGALAALGFAGTPAKAQLRSITIGTNPSGTTFYLLGGGFARLFQEKLQIRSTAQPMGGSSVYLPMVASGEMTLGVSSNIDAGMAFSGQFAFPQPMPELRAIGNVWQLPYAYITRADTGIVQMEDLRGSRVMGDMPTNVALTQINIAMLASGGLDVTDVQWQRSGGLIDGINAVTEGRTDAAPVATSMPALIEAHNAVSGGLRIIANGDLAIDGFYGELVPGTREFLQQPREASPFVIGETPIVAYDTLLVTSAALSDDDVYLLTKTMHENWADLQQDYPPIRSVSSDDFVLVNTTVPYHPGAIRYFEEAGLWTQAHAANQARFN